MYTMKLSIVTTLYQSAPYINEFYDRIIEVIPSDFDDYEIIFVNDASPDNVLDEAKKLLEVNTRVKILDLAKNVGQHKAIMCGLKYSDGDYVFLIDVDLEEEPELLIKFWEKYERCEEYDVIYGVQKSRKGGFFERISGSLFYKVFNKLSETKITNNLALIRLMNRQYVDSLIKYEEREIFLAGLFELAGFNQCPYPITKLSKGITSYTLSRKIKLLVNAISSFSERPLQMIFYLGVFITLISVAYVLYVLLMSVFYDLKAGWTSIIASIWLLGGVVILCIGVVGIYISKVFMEVKQRPYAQIKKIHER